jgi:predicted RND superfamily exporter protein
MNMRGMNTEGARANARAEAFFQWVTAWRWPVVVLSIGLIIGSGAFLPQLSKDTSADAFIDASHPALVDKRTVEDLFGLSDPIVVAVLADGDARGVFTRDTLKFVRALTESVQRVHNVDPGRVISLATEKNIEGTEEGMIVEQFFEEVSELLPEPVDSEARVAAIAAAINQLPLYQGSLVARDGSATVIVAELLDPEMSRETFRAIQEVVDAMAIPKGVDVQIAGEGAVAGELSAYIDNDAARLNPLAGLIITVVLFFAFWSLRAIVLPNLIVLATVAASLGLMAASGVSFYVITNGLIVNLIGIAVADSIHIFTQFAEEAERDPGADNRQLTVAAMTQIWRPITLTTVTTMAGFAALAAAAEMPPVRFFGIFGAVGVGAAWIYSMTLLPAAMAIWPGKTRAQGPSSASRRAGATRSTRFLSTSGRFVIAHPKVIVGLAAIVTIAGLFGGARMTVNDSTIENFKATEPLYQADKAINRAMDGTYYLDVLIDTRQPEGVFLPENLQRIEDLQNFLVTLPHINGTTSVVDYIKLMHRAVNENRADAYRVPDDPNLIAQLFLLYRASADPTDFEEEVDSQYRRALVRARVGQSVFQNNRILVPAVERYLSAVFNSETLEGRVTGPINVDYHWIDAIARNHAWSVGLAFCAVFAMASLVFRSAVGGLLAVAPVAIAVLLVYAVMGWAGIWLGVGTSMFAAIAIGLGVDFSIHTIDRLREIIGRSGYSDEAILTLYPTTGRALLFNFLAVALGFGVLTTSDIPPLIEFGSLVAVAVSASFLSSLTVLPALVKLLKPAFLIEGGKA